jgi:acetyl-CoA carboxylase biotin carboxyl carrier protein
VSNGQIDFQDVLKLVELIKSSSNFSEIRLRSGDVEVELRRSGASAFAPPAEAARPGAQSVQPVAPPPAPAPASTLAPTSTATQAGRDSTPKRAATREGATVIKAPMVGTVYHAPEPGAKPFVEVGQRVSAGEQLCIIEVMKLMNSIDAETLGVVSEILIADGEAVQYGQELFVISAR